MKFSTALLSSILVFVSFCSQARSYPYSITGKISGVPEGTVFYLIRTKKNMSADTVSKTSIMNSGFSFKGKIAYIGEVYFVKLDTSVVKLPTKRNSWLRLVLDNSKITITGSLQNWPVANVSGSAMTTAFDKYMSFLDSTSKRLTQELKQAKGDSIMRAMAFKKYKEETLRYLHDDPNSHASAFLVYAESEQTLSLEEKKFYYNKFPSWVKNTHHGRLLRQRLQMPETLTRRHKANQRFLQKNTRKKDVVQLSNGSQYKVLVMGSGVKPSSDSHVRVRYTGRLTNGKLFDESSTAIQVPLSNVIKGWRTILPLMPVGSTWRLYIPPDLGYGDQEKSTIPARSILIFDVELIEVLP